MAARTHFCPFSDCIDAADQRLGLNRELRGQMVLARYRAGRRAILDSFADQGERGTGIPVGFECGMLAEGQPVVQQ